MSASSSSRFLPARRWTSCGPCASSPCRGDAPLLAANLAVVLYVCTFFSTVLIVEKCVPAVIAYGLGNWVGTFWAVKRSRR